MQIAIRFSSDTAEMLSLVNSYNTTTYYLEIANTLDSLSLSNTLIPDNLESNNNDADISKTIGRHIQLVLRPILIIFGTFGNLLTFYVMRKGSLKSVPICFHMSILALADTGKYYLIFKIFIYRKYLSGRY